MRICGTYPDPHDRPPRKPPEHELPEWVIDRVDCFVNQTKFRKENRWGYYTPAFRAREMRRKEQSRKRITREMLHSIRSLRKNWKPAKYPVAIFHSGEYTEDELVSMIPGLLDTLPSGPVGPAFSRRPEVPVRRRLDSYAKAMEVLRCVSAS